MSNRNSKNKGTSSGSNTKSKNKQKNKSKHHSKSYSAKNKKRNSRSNISKTQSKRSSANKKVSKTRSGTATKTVKSIAAKARREKQVVPKKAFSKTPIKVALISPIKKSKSKTPFKQKVFKSESKKIRMLDQDNSKKTHSNRYTESKRATAKKKSAPTRSEKKSASQRFTIKYAVHNIRTKGEDRWITVTSKENGVTCKIVGIFDGHGGTNTCQYIKDNFMYYFNAFAKQLGQQTSMIPFPFALKRTAETIDKKLRNWFLSNHPNDESGSTLCVVLVEVIKGTPIAFSAINVGDSRAVLSRAGNAIAITKDHKPDSPDELARLQYSKGNINQLPGDVVRVGPLAVSRTIGDFRVRESYEGRGIIPTPEVFNGKIQTGDEFVIVASDGLWDVISNKEAVKFIRTRLRNGKTFKMALKELATYSVRTLKSTDDVTIVGCLLKPPSTFSNKSSETVSSTGDPLMMSSLATD
jgi:protein phosphatase 1L